MSSPRPRARRLPPDERRALLADAGAAVAVDGGLEAVTLRSVGARAGVAYSLVGHYFDSAEALRAAAFEAATADDLRRTVEEVDRFTTPLSRLRALLDRWVEPDRDPIGLLWLDAWARARAASELRAAVGRAMGAGHDLVVRLLSEGHATGDLRCPDPPATAWRLLTLLDGQIVHSSLGLDDRPVDIRRAVTELVEIEVALPPGTLVTAPSPEV